MVRLSLSFFDKYNRWVAAISGNMWSVDTTTTWDVEYISQHLKLRSAPRKIIFDMWIENGEVFMTGTMYFSGFPITISKQYLEIGNQTFSGLNMEGGNVGIKCDI